MRRSSWAAVIMIAQAIGCGVLSPEEQLLKRFFEASRLHDTTIVATMASVTFNPQVEGVVRDFEVEDIQQEGDSRRVTIRADVRHWGGTVTERTLVFTLVRKQNRWFISQIR